VTLAVCVQCGHPKVGALVGCGHCSFEPTTPTDQARSILLSDRHLSPDALHDAGAQIQLHGAPPLDERAVEAIAAQLAASGPLVMPLGCRIAVWTPVVLMVALLVFVVVLYAHCLPRAGR
jgi:hypothetical protein